MWELSSNIILETEKGRGQGSKGTGNFSRQSDNKGNRQGAKESKMFMMFRQCYTLRHEVAPFLHHVSDQSPGRLVWNRRMPLGQEHCAGGTWSRLWRNHRWRSRAHIPICLKAAEHGIYRFSSTLPKLYTCLFLGTDNRSSMQLQCLHVLPERHYRNTLVKPLGNPEGPVINTPRKEGWQCTVLSFGLSTSMRVHVSTKRLKPVLAYSPLHGVKLHMYLDDWPRVTRKYWYRSLLQSKHPGEGPCTKGQGWL